MNTDQQFSDELLNSFVDNELTTAEKSRVYVRINQDEPLNRRVCELRKTRDLVQMAYKDLPSPPSIRPVTGKTGQRLRHGGVAGLVFTLGVLFSWFQFNPVNSVQPDPQQATRATDIPLATARDGGSTGNAGAISGATARDGGSTGNAGAISGATARDGGSTGNAGAISGATARNSAGTDAKPLEVGAVSGEMKILFHLNTGNPERLKDILDEAESLLQLYQEQKQPARVDIVTNGQGLNLLLANGSPYPERIRRMQKQYRNLTFAACQNTMERFSGMGIKTDLLPGVLIIDSAVAQIIRLQQEGWVYIQV